MSICSSITPRIHLSCRIAGYFRGVPILVIFVGTRASRNLESRIFTLVISHKRVHEFVATDTGHSNTFIDVVDSRARLDNEAFHSSRNVTLQLLCTVIRVV